MDNVEKVVDIVVESIVFEETVNQTDISSKKMKWTSGLTMVTKLLMLMKKLLMRHNLQKRS